MSAPRLLNKGACLRHEGEPVTDLPVLDEGIVLSSRRLADGTQQHLAYHVGGDMLDLEGYVLERASAVISALTPSVVVMLDRSALTEILEAHPRLGDQLQRQMAANATSGC